MRGNIYTLARFPEYRTLIVVAVLISIMGSLLLSNMNMAWMFTIALFMGVSLYHAAFGFSAAYRQLFLHRQVKGAQSHLILIGITTLLFAPFLAEGSAFGNPVGGAIAPAGIGMAFGAFIFGVGMQLANACASGTLYTVGGGNPRMLIVLIFFCAGAFWGSLDLSWWQDLPGFGAVSLGEKFGWTTAVSLQLIFLAAIFVLLRVFSQNEKIETDTDTDQTRMSKLFRGPWPLVWAALSLAFLNWLTLISAGHPWSITWGFTLWAGKFALLLGWDPATSSFWSSGFQLNALRGSILADTTSVMNIGILAGAALASLAVKRKTASWSGRKWRSMLAAIIGGLLLGYGARLAYGCNIGAFVSGVASTSLHGWVWIVCALPGNWIGVKLRPYFHLTN